MNKKKKRRARNEIFLVAEHAAKYGFSGPSVLPKGERFISPNDAARTLNITGEAVKQWIYHRRLPAVKLSNGYWKIRVKDLEEFMKARQDVRRRRIMLIDPDGTSSEGIVKAICDLEHDPVVAHNYSDALLKAADLLPSLFIVNLAVSGPDTWEFISRIRMHRNLRRLPILMISATALTEKEGVIALEAGIQGLILRPASSKLLQDEIEKILSRVM